MRIYTFLLFLMMASFAVAQPRSVIKFTKDWKFNLGDVPEAKEAQFNDESWRTLNLPHDWSIEFPFDEKSPTGTGGGALRGGIAWYRKTFKVALSSQNKNVLIDFDGVYRKSEVWINGHYLGIRPNGYISFQYDLTPYLKFGSNEENVLAVRVDNGQQPNSRWYSGSGIYRNVWLETVNKISVDHWGTYVTTPDVNQEQASVILRTKVKNNSGANGIVSIKTTIYNPADEAVNTITNPITAYNEDVKDTEQKFVIKKPILWSVEHPALYKAVTQIMSDNKVIDEYTTTFGIRTFNFDVNKGFFLNGKHLKIRGVCDHHDLGCLGTAVNYRALERQIEILKGMGCNAIRTSHNPPTPELLEIADKQGMLIMDEAFDMWKKSKTDFDYHLDWDEWHVKDLKDQIVRDRNHPSVIIWSVGNEIVEQWSEKGDKGDTSGRSILRELVSIVKSLDATRPTVTANNEMNEWNNLLKANATDLTGYNYSHKRWDSVLYKWPGKPFIVTESTSALETRGVYDMPSDSIRRWPERWDKPLAGGNADLTCSAYDNVSAPWGSTHEESLKVLEKYDHVSGMFIWTGFDYIGEPTPYPWPARSSYFGIIDLAGFPKDSYYLYQSIWTDKTVLHLLPHWNWVQGQTVDVWAYYNNADEVELFINGKSAGIRKKTGDDMHVMWRVQYEPGSIKAVSRKNGEVVLTKEIKTAGKPAKIILTADRNNIKADGTDLSFITAKIVDAEGNMIPDADQLIKFSVKGDAEIVGVDNGSETSMESFKGIQHKAFKGLCLAVIQSKEKRGQAQLTATADGLQNATVVVEMR